MNNRKQIIWIFGGSGAGKDRFIRYLLEKRSHNLLHRFHWENKKIIACKESLLWIPMHYHDPLIEKRKSLPKIIKKLVVSDADIILVKGQDWDLRDGTLTKAMTEVHDATHSILYLHVPILTAFKRWKTKPWKRFWYSPITVRRWLRHQLKALKELSPSIPITALESSGDDYPEIDFPPEL